MAVFKTAAFNHSATTPGADKLLRAGGARQAYRCFLLTRFISSMNSSGSGSATVRVFAARRIRALIVRTSCAEYFLALIG